MIYRMARDVGEAMRARGFRVREEYGPERTQRDGYYGGVIVFERDRESGDRYEAPRGAKRNARKIATRMLGVVATVYAQSAVSGARVNEHESECEALVDGLLASLYDWFERTRAGVFTPISLGYVPASDRDDTEVWPGVVYQVRFQVPRAVSVLDYQGIGAPTGAANSISNRTDVTLKGAPSGTTPETGCGV